MKSVKVPKKFEPIFKKTEKIVQDFFEKKDFDVSKGTIEISGERYLFIRASSLSVDFFECISNLYKGSNEKEARDFSRQLLFDMAHAIGIKDAEHFQNKMQLKTFLEKISAGPPNFAYTGWAFVEGLDDSNPNPGKNFHMYYKYPYSFEADSWIKAGKKSKVPVCFMNAGYSSGWCEQSIGSPVVSTEVTCRAKGDKECIFVMAHPSRIKEYVKAFLKKNKNIARCITKEEMEDFFEVKSTAFALQEMNEKLEESNKELKNRTKALEEKARSIAFLNEMGDAFTRSFSKKELFEICMTYSKKMFSPYKGVVWTYNKKSKKLVPTAEWGFGKEIQKTELFSEACLAFKERTLQVGKCSHHPKGGKFICIPIIANGEVFGVFSICVGSEDLSRAEQDLISQITRSLALAITNLDLRDSLYEMSIRDYLTGLYNRRYMEDMFSKALANAKRKKSSVGIIMLDIDYFKNFNDTYGHERGDIILKKVGEYLKMDFREGDILCRFGGEEFIIIMIESSEKTTLDRAERLRQKIMELGEKEKITISVGVATYPKNGAIKKSLFKAVDKALYKAKEGGRNQVVLAKV